MRLSANVRIALLLCALAAVFGCAAPTPPRPPGATNPAAAGTAQSVKGKPTISSPIVSPPVKPPLLAAPQDLAAIPVRDRSGSLEVDLSWAISDAANLAGYNVYRSEQPGERGERLNQHVLAVAEFRDTTVSAGVTYHYSVTAVGAAGRESAPSAPATVSVSESGEGSP